MLAQRSFLLPAYAPRALLSREDSALTPRETVLLAIVRDVCTQDLGDRFRDHIDQAFAAGMCAADLKEAILHLTIYASFPKVLCAIIAFNSAVGSGTRSTSTPTTAAPAVNLFAQPGVREALLSIDTDFADLAMRMGGEIWGRGGVTAKERAFMCLGSHLCNGTLDPIPVHAEIALQAGATEDALREALTHACVRTGQRARAADDMLEAFLAMRGEARQ